MITPLKPARLDTLTRHYVVAACLSQLVRCMHAAGCSERAALDALRDAPDKIEAALTRGAQALVLYRLDPDAPRGVVSDRDEKLKSFEAQAKADGVQIIGINPLRVATLAAAMAGFREADGGESVERLH